MRSPGTASWEGKIAGTVLAALALAALGVSLIWPPGNLPDVPLCAMKTYTGLQCPGCGLTRAFCAISHGQFRAAWGFNPFGFIFYAGALVLAGRPLLWRFAPKVEKRLFNGRAVVYGVPAILVAMWLFGIVRIAGLHSR